MNVWNLERDALLDRLAYRRLAYVDTTILDLGDDGRVHSISSAQVEILGSLIVNINCTGVSAG